MVYNSRRTTWHPWGFIIPSKGIGFEWQALSQFASEPG